MLEELTKIVGRVFEAEPMSRHTHFRIGGPTRWFVEAKTPEMLQQIIAVADREGVRWFVFGGGSNLLVADEGFDGLTIKMAMRGVTVDGLRVVAEAGVLSSALARKTAEAGLAGFEWAISLPGTIGGAVRGNAGCFGGEMRDVIESVLVLRNGQLAQVPVSEAGFGYRESVFKHNSDVIVSVTMRLVQGDADTLARQLETTLEKRKTSQPLYAGSAGCIFKNLEVSDGEMQRLTKKFDVPLPVEMQTSRRISAGWLIDQLDLKGMKIGQAQVSPVHGNFIVNLGTATASDVMQLISLIKTRARNTFGIELKEEVQYVESIVAGSR